MSRRFFFFFSVIFVSLNLALSSADPELLKNGDVKKVMKEMLAQHVDKKEVTAQLLQQSIQEYIDQFDPQRIYLLQSEVNQLTTINPDQKLLLKEYADSDLVEFQNIDKVIQHAIERARHIRQDLLTHPNSLFIETQRDDVANKWRDSEVKRPFAKDVPELKDRIKGEFEEYVNLERKRFGEQALAQNKEKALTSIENQLNHHENEYLYKDDNGKDMSAQKKENLFATHVLKALAKKS